MKTNLYPSFRFSKSGIAFTGISLLMFLFASTFSFAQQPAPLTQSHYSSHNVKSTDGKIYNLSGFEKREKVKINSTVASLMGSSAKNNPDYGYAVHPKEKDAVELVDKRQPNQSEYVYPDGSIIVRSSSEPLNFIDENGYPRAINSKLNSVPVSENVYRAPNQLVPKKINTLTGKTIFETREGEVAVNQQTTMGFEKQLSAIGNKKELAVKNAEIGDDGSFASEVFPMTDMQIILMKDGSVKTNYIIKDKDAIDKNSDRVIFEDEVTLPEDLHLEVNRANGIESGYAEDWEGGLVVLDKNNNERGYFKIPLIYDHNYTINLVNAKPAYLTKESLVTPGVNSESFIYGTYRIIKISANKYKVAVVVKSDWLLSEERAYPVVIDPQQWFLGTPIGTAGKCAVKILGAIPSDNPLITWGGVGCYSTTTVLPCGYMIGDGVGQAYQPGYNVRVDGSGYITNGCTMYNTWQTFYGPCGHDPRAAGFFWYCNLPFTLGTCGGVDYGMDGLLSRCILTKDGEPCDTAHAPSCSQQTMVFWNCLQTRCSGGAAGGCFPVGTGVTQIAWAQPFVVDVSAYPIQTVITSPAGSSPVNVCPLPATVTLNAGTQYGVPIGASTANCTTTMGGTYTYTWTAAGPGAFVLGTPTLSSTTFGSAIAGTYTITVVTCGACGTSGNACGDLGAAPNCATATFLVVVGTAVAPTAISPVAFCGGATGALTVTNPQTGYTYTWYSGATTGGAVLGIGTSYTPPAQVGGTTLQYTVAATLPCASAAFTITVTWGNPPAPSTTGALVCTGATANLSATCASGTCSFWSLPAGGVQLSATCNYTTPALAGTTTYYVQCTSGACSSTRTPVTATIGPLAVSSTGTTPTCSPSTSGFTSSYSGGAPYRDVTVCSTTVPSGAAPNGAACFDPSDLIGCPAGNAVSATLVTPACVLNPMDANSIQSVSVNLPNGCGKDVKMWLQSPAGSVFALASLQNLNKGNTCYCPTFTPGAVTNLPNVNNTPYSGTYIPDGGALGTAFTGQNPYAGTGTWTLWVNDATAAGGCSAGTITISSFCITFRTACTPTYVWTGACAGGSLSSTTISNPVFTPPPGSYSCTYTVTVTDPSGCVGTSTVNVSCSLPITLSSFTGKNTKAGNVIEWITQSETNNDYFTLERSRDGRGFDAIGYVSSKAHGGNSTTALYYTFTDPDVTQGIYYYQLRQTDRDGKFKDSHVISLVVSSDEIFIVKPNPTVSSVEVIYQCDISESAYLTVYDYRGERIAAKEITCSKGINSYKLDMSEQPNGIYLISLTANGQVYKSKLVKTN